MSFHRPFVALAIVTAIALPVRAEETSAASADDALWALETAHVRGAGRWSVGVFAPLRYGLTESIELESHPLTFLLAPNAAARVAHWTSGGITLTGVYGLSMPTLLLNTLAKSWFFPSGDTSGEIAWTLIPSVGVLASGPIGEAGQLTGKADVAVGIPLAGRTASGPIDSFIAPLNLLLAPVTNTFRTHLGVGYDHGLSSWLRVRTSLDAYLIGNGDPKFAQLDPFFVSGHVGLDIRVGEQSRFTIGAIWWNHDQGRVEQRKDADGFVIGSQKVRSNDFLPTIDFIWAG